jgi:peptidoglycan-associated lipoprotein
MKLSTIAQWLLLGLLFSFAASGCRKRPYDVTGIPNPPHTHVPDIDQAPPIDPDWQPIGIDTNVPVVLYPLGPGHPGWGKDRSPLQAETVYFAFDSSAIQSGERAKVGRVADFLKGNPVLAIEIEGHCDERGTEEYNRSLGERRALALREELIRLGIEPTRVDTVTLGEDRPVAQGSNEEAWRQNRRGEFVVLSPP